MKKKSSPMPGTNGSSGSLPAGNTLRHTISQVRLDNWDSVKLWDLEAFAAECGHALQPVFPIFLVLVDQALAAFYYAHPVVTIRPTVHPMLLSPRAFHDAAKSVIAYTRSFGDPLWLIDEKSKLASAPLLAKLGLEHERVSVFGVR